MTFQTNELKVHIRKLSIHGVGNDLLTQMKSGRSNCGPIWVDINK